MSIGRQGAWGLLAIALGAGPAQGASESTVYSFTKGADGFEPAQLLRGDDGNLYGRSHDAPNGFGVAGGVIFRLTPAGTLAPLARFHDNWMGQIIKAADGNFYGTTANGLSGPGVLFRVTPAGALTILHTFGETDATEVDMPLAEGPDGRLYGSAALEGNNAGTLFRFDRATSVLTVIHAFDGEDGWRPVALLDGGDGALYGATATGGPAGDGTIFKLTAAGAVQPLHALDDAQNDGSNVTGLIRAADGNFYGTTLAGGANGRGTIFRLTPAGAFTVLHAFEGEEALAPEPLMQAADGHFYGTLHRGGGGSLYRMNAAGKVVKLLAFAGTPLGASAPQGPLVQGADGNLYGAAAHGGGNGWGAVFRVAGLADSVVNVSPEHASRLLQESQCLGASVFDRDNVAQALAPIAFQRTGANPGSASTVAGADGVATHCWTGVTAGIDRVTAGAATLTGTASVTWSKRRATGVAKGYVELLPLQNQLTIRPQATLTDAASGAPIVGRKVRFRANAKTLCSGVTAANGTAQCKATTNQDLQAVVGQRYQALLENDPTYLNTTIAGRLACIADNCAP